MKKIGLLLLIILFVTGCNAQISLKDKMEALDVLSQDQVHTEQQEDEDVVQEVEETQPNLEGLNVESLMEKMTLEEKVAQLFIVDFYSYTKDPELTEWSTDLNVRLEAYPVGGVIFFGKNIVDRDQVTGLINELQQKSYLPMFISIDEEGGLVSRLQNNIEMGMTKTPLASVIGNTGNHENAYSVGYILGRELNALGFNMNFAPVADVNTNPNNPIIGDRAFSSNPEIVGDMVVQLAKGLKENGVAAVAKHFPGHGDTSTDTHTGAVFVEHDRQRLNEIELVPFKKAIENDITGIMVAHIALPQVTGNEEPASLSYKILTEILREDMQYGGLIITDALNMGAISENYTSDEACVKALQAGVDILLMPEDFILGYNGVLQAISEGILTEERIDASVERILQLKITLGLMKTEDQRQPLSVIGSQEHMDLIEKITE